MKAPKLSEYVLSLELNGNAFKEMLDMLNKIRSYTFFITQPLNIGMFIPAKLVYGKWEVLEKPYEGMFEIEANTKKSGWKYLQRDKEHGDNRYYDSVKFELANKEYKQALENVIFKGCTIEFLQDYPNEYIIHNQDIKIHASWAASKTIEDIIHLVELTDKKAKELGL